MYFWNMEKHWHKEAAYLKKNKKPCWRQCLKTCRKATGRRCSRSWGLWDCDNIKNTAYFPKGKYAVSVYRESRSNSRSTAAGEQPPEVCLAWFFWGFAFCFWGAKGAGISLFPYIHTTSCHYFMRRGESFFTFFARTEDFML